MIFLSLRVTADAGGGLKIRAHLRPVLQGFGGGQPPTSTHKVYTCALLVSISISAHLRKTFILLPYDFHVIVQMVVLYKVFLLCYK